MPHLRYWMRASVDDNDSAFSDSSPLPAWYHHTRVTSAGLSTTITPGRRRSSLAKRPSPDDHLLPESRRQPYPITWEEQDALFPRLLVHLQRMVLFAVINRRSSAAKSSAAGGQLQGISALPKESFATTVVEVERT